MTWSLTDLGYQKAEKAKQKLAGLRGQLLAPAPAGEKSEAASLVAQRDARGGVDEAANLLINSLPAKSHVSFKYFDTSAVYVSARLEDGSVYIAPTRVALADVYDFVKQHIDEHPIFNRQAIIDALRSCLNVSLQFSTDSLFNALKVLRPGVTMELFTTCGATRK